MEETYRRHEDDNKGLTLLALAGLAFCLGLLIGLGRGDADN